MGLSIRFVDSIHYSVSLTNFAKKLITAASQSLKFLPSFNYKAGRNPYQNECRPPLNISHRKLSKVEFHAISWLSPGYHNDAFISNVTQF